MFSSHIRVRLKSWAKQLLRSHLLEFDTFEHQGAGVINTLESWHILHPRQSKMMFWWLTSSRGPSVRIQKILRFQESLSQQRNNIYIHVYTCVYVCVCCVCVCVSCFPSFGLRNGVWSPGPSPTCASWSNTTMRKSRWTLMLAAPQSCARTRWSACHMSQSFCCLGMGGASCEPQVKRATR